MKHCPHGYHLLALITICVWGTTFASTKILLTHGLMPSEIMFYRFLIAYLLSWLFSRKVKSDNYKDEWLLAAAGFMGGTLYFWAENTAISLSITSNVALIVCTTPILTALLSILCIKEERMTSKLVIGSLIALGGVCLVVLNGTILKFNPLGDTLAFIAALSWAVYSVLLRRFDRRYSTWFITRKIFFYGLITMLPIVLAKTGGDFRLYRFYDITVAGNLIFLAVVASLLCFYSWNVVLEKLGTIRASNYLYTQPIVSLACSVMILKEPLTPIAGIGTLFILIGIYIAERKFSAKKRMKS